MLIRLTKSSGESRLLERAAALRGAAGVAVHIVSVPTPVLLDGDTPITPNRTNYFPTPQLMLATASRARLEAEHIPWSLSFGDYKSVPDMAAWYSDLQPYGELDYGATKLTKCFIGDGLDRFRIEVENARILCITANFTLEARAVVDAIAITRRVNPSCLIIVGGRDAMARRGYFISRGADIVAHGDADHSLPELLVRLYRGGDLSGLLEGSTLVHVGKRIKLDELPFMAFDFVRYPLSRYCESGGGPFLPNVLNRGGVAYYETSRGCDRECSYCTERLTKRSEMSVQRFKDEIAWYRRCGIAAIMLSDDNLLQRLNHGERGERELCEMFTYLREQQMTWEFPVGIEIGRLMKKGESRFHERLFDLMFWNNDDPDHFVGAFRSLIPFENVLSQNELSQVKLRKMRDINENVLILARVLEAGLPQVNLAVIIGFPDETAASLEQTRRNLEWLMTMRDEVSGRSSRRIATHINFSIFAATPFPGTPYFDETRTTGRLEYDIEEHPELWNLYTSVVRGNTFSAADISRHRRDLLAFTRSQQSGGKVKLHIGTGEDGLLGPVPTRTHA